MRLFVKTLLIIVTLLGLFSFTEANQDTVETTEIQILPAEPIPRNVIQELWEVWNHTAVRDKVASSGSDLTSLSLIEIDTIIFESLFRSHDKFGFKQKALICDVYLKELSAIKLPEIEPSLQRSSYLRDYFIYFFGVNNVAIRGFDSCFEKCMKKKASVVFVTGNRVDKVEFLVGMPTNVAWWTGSCTWDCI